AGEMHALHQTVGGYHPLTARRGLEQCGIVADAQGHRALGASLLQRRALEVTADQPEFTQRHGRPPAAQRPRRDALTSTLRRRGASLSRMPLMYLWPSVAPNTLAISMPSLITTL